MLDSAQELRKSMTPREKAISLHTFERSADFNTLLMDDTGALGLDLSFVEHVFLMEPLADQALEQQIVSRAHRMGATRPVHVECLVMKVALARSSSCIFLALAVNNRSPCTRISPPLDPLAAALLFSIRHLFHAVVLKQLRLA
jgi:Helicase conserved C-terminal domain